MGSEMCIRDSRSTAPATTNPTCTMLGAVEHADAGGRKGEPGAERSAVFFAIFKRTARAPGTVATGTKPPRSARQARDEPWRCARGRHAARAFLLAPRRPTRGEDILRTPFESSKRRFG